jgi:ABC-type nitrate/sulfonate/bicarbonate transport system substrate-binding protein
MFRSSLILVSSLSLLAAACGGTAQPATSSAPVAAASHKFAISWTSPSAAYTQFFVAEDKGLFQKRGVDVNLRFLDAGAAAAALVAGEDDGDASSASLNTIISGAPVEFVANLNAAPVFSLYASKQFNTIDDLKGQTIHASTSGGAPDVCLHGLLEKHGLVPDKDVKLLHGGNPATAVAAMSSGSVNAAILSPPSTYAAKKAGFQELTSCQKEQIPGLDTPFAFRKAVVQKDPAGVKLVLQSLKDATEWAKANPAETKHILGKYTKIDDADILDAAYNEFLPYLVVGPINVTDVQATLKYSSDPKAAALKPADTFDNSLVEQL